MSRILLFLLFIIAVTFQKLLLVRVFHIKKKNTHTHSMPILENFIEKWIKIICIIMSPKATYANISLISFWYCSKSWLSTLTLLFRLPQLQLLPPPFCPPFTQSNTVLVPFFTYFFHFYQEKFDIYHHMYLNCTKQHDGLIHILGNDYHNNFS